MFVLVEVLLCTYGHVNICFNVAQVLKFGLLKMLGYDATFH